MNLKNMLGAIPFIVIGIATATADITVLDWQFWAIMFSAASLQFIDFGE
jgi:hypothetical protein